MQDGRPFDASLGAQLTPMMAQYAAIKAAHPDCLLFYRMGDFFELFFQDAETASRALGIQLTKRGKHLGEDIPMCGVPVSRADDYLRKLIAQGFRVAVCEQLEDPAEAKKRGGKSVVKRDVVRLVTPGTLTEESLLDGGANNYLTALFRTPNAPGGEPPRYALASLDISTGEFLVSEAVEDDLPSELARLAPAEIILSDALDAEKELHALLASTAASRTPAPRAYFDSLAGERALKAELGVAALDGLASFSRAELAAIGALLKYVEITQAGKRPMLRPPRKGGAGGALVIDAATRANLELTRSSGGEKLGSLLHAIDRTLTSGGARELASRLVSPLNDAAAINARLDAVAFLLEEEGLRAALRQTLKATPDMARALARLKFGRSGPRDPGAIRDGLASARQLASAIAGALTPPEDLRTMREAGVASVPRKRASFLPGLPAGLEAIFARPISQAGGALADRLNAALADELPLSRRDGGFVRAGYRGDLDDNLRLRDDSRGVLGVMQASYVQATGIKSLKIRYNNVLGYFVEVTANMARGLMTPPHDATFRHRQTLANAVRFTTAELAEAEARILTAGERALAIEQDVFDELTADIAAQEQELSALAAAMAGLDCVCGLAALAREQNYVRPVIDESLAFRIEGGRHPVVEQALRQAQGGQFIGNDCILGAAGKEEDAAARLWLVTGPNMAGKSTFLRQNALITVMAQMGSFVPARAAHIGAADRLFCRAGAADDLARGRSTFMVEMVETAAILNQASERSLVILDEIGRGTATFDGLSIAWAAVEYLNGSIRCRTLFATHYHELTELAGRLQGVANVTMAVKEWQDEIIFMHKVAPGAADRSYGIQVAKLAGLPQPVIVRARQVLTRLEAGGRKRSTDDLFNDLPLFAALGNEPERDRRGVSPIEQAVEELSPDSMTPREALDTIYQLKELLAQTRRPVGWVER